MEGPSVTLSFFFFFGGGGSGSKFKCKLQGYTGFSGLFYSLGFTLTTWEEFRAPDVEYYPYLASSFYKRSDFFLHPFETMITSATSALKLL